MITPAEKIENEFAADNAETLLAHKFSELLCDYLEPGQMQIVVARNNEPGAIGCASQDYCDANQIMLDAFLAIHNHQMDLSSLVDCAHVQRAWNFAKKANFFIKEYAR